MIIPFDIKYRPQIESGEYKVVIYASSNSITGCPVGILKWDYNSDAGCIVGCFRSEGKDRLYIFNEYGEHVVSGMKKYNLFINTPEPDLSEFEKACVNLYVKGRVDGFSEEELSKEALKEVAAELLELARKEE